MTHVVAAWSPRGGVRTDLVYLGWQPAQLDVGPAPMPPRQAVPDEVSPGWVAAQRREQSRLSRPARVTAVACLGLAAADVVCWLAYDARLAIAAALLVTGVAARAVWQIWQGQRALAARLRAEQQRVARFREVQLSEFAARQQQYNRLHQDWQRRAAASWRKPQWRPVTLPTSVRRVDVAGGTLAGWSALLTTIGVPRLVAGAEVTVLDLTEGGVAAELIAVARRLGVDPAVWLLPADLARLPLGTELSARFLADILDAESVAMDSALLARVLGALDDGATMAKLLAGLRALGQIGAPEQHLGAALSHAELGKLAALAGRGAERLVVDRAWAIEARLRILEPLGSAPPMPRRQLSVASLDAAAADSATLGAFLTAAVTATLRRTPVNAPWHQTIVLLGAERMRGDLLDRLSDASERAGTGLILGYRSIPAHARERLGRGDCAVAFMRLGNAEEARFVAEHIGTEHRMVIGQLTDTVGTSVTDTDGDSQTASDTVTFSDSRTAGRTRGRRGAPFGPASRDSSTGISLSEGISTGTSWGVSRSRAIGANDSLARTVQRSREFLVEQHELQHLPERAVVLVRQRQVLLADADPAIMALPNMVGQ